MSVFCLKLDLLFGNFSFELFLFFGVFKTSRGILVVNDLAKEIDRLCTGSDKIARLLRASLVLSSY